MVQKSMIHQKNENLETIVGFDNKPIPSLSETVCHVEKLIGRQKPPNLLEHKLVDLRKCPQ